VHPDVCNVLVPNVFEVVASDIVGVEDYALFIHGYYAITSRLEERAKNTSTKCIAARLPHFVLVVACASFHLAWTTPENVARSV